MIDGMRWLVKDAQPDDSLFFHCRFVQSLMWSKVFDVEKLQTPDMEARLKMNQVKKMTATMKVMFFKNLCSSR
jgi:hypothetical protein